MKTDVQEEIFIGDLVSFCSHWFFFEPMDYMVAEIKTDEHGRKMYEIHATNQDDPPVLYCRSKDLTKVGDR